MAKNSGIEWTHHTFNPWRGCTKVSEGCKHCYAETLSKRNPKVLGMWGPQGTRVMASESMWREPLKWNEEAEKMKKERKCPSCGHYWWSSWTKPGADSPCPTCKTPSYRPRHRVFCASLADVFEGPETCSEEAYQVIQEARARLFELIDRTPNLDWLLLTKRPENILKLTPWGWGTVESYLKRVGEEVPLAFNKGTTIIKETGVIRPNVWIGTSVENQAAADKRIPELLKVPAVVRFLSCEPLLGPVDLKPRYWMNPGCCGCPSGIECWNCPSLTGKPAASIHWVIAGGESGSDARPMHPDWARSLRDQCQSAGVSFFFKQHGEWREPQEGESYDTAKGRAQKTPAFIMGLDGTVNCYHDERIKDPRVVLRVGKSAAGRLLDGRTWDELPAVEAPHAH